MAGQNLKYNLPKKDFLDIYKHLADIKFNEVKYGVGKGINILDFIEVLIAERVSCNKFDILKNKYL